MRSNKIVTVDAVVLELDQALHLKVHSSVPSHSGKLVLHLSTAYEGKRAGGYSPRSRQ
jgi:hypothetical protein